MDSFVRHTEAAASETLSEKSAIALESTKAAIKAGVAATRDLRNTIRSTRDCIARSAVTASASDTIMSRWWYKQDSGVHPAGDIASEELA